MVGNQRDGYTQDQFPDIPGNEFKLAITFDYTLAQRRRQDII